MKCPRCQYSQVSSSRCIACGHEFDEMLSPMERKAQSPEQPPVAPAPRPPYDDEFGDGEDTPVETPRPIQEMLQNARVETSPYERPIRPSLRIVRTLAGVAGAGLGAWLFVVGQEITFAPIHMVVLIVYGCISLFWIASAPIRVSVRQFVFEMILFIAATLFLKVAVPEAFDVGRLTNSMSGPKGGRVERPWRHRKPANDRETFLQKTRELSAAGEALIAQEEGALSWDEWSLQCEKTKRDFRLLDEGEKGDFADIHSHLTVLQSRMARWKRIGSDESLKSTLLAIESLGEALEPLSLSQEEEGDESMEAETDSQ